MRLFLIEKSGKDESMRVCAYMDVHAHARGCATYRGVEEKIGSVTDTWCYGLSRFLSYPRRKRSRSGWWGGKEEVRQEEERVHLLNLPACGSSASPRALGMLSHTPSTQRHRIADTWRVTPNIIWVAWQRNLWMRDIVWLASRWHAVPTTPLETSPETPVFVRVGM